MTEALQPTITLELEPLDVLFFRDGRPFGPATRATTGMPQPQTLTGALRTWLLDRLGVNFKRLGVDIAEGRSFAEATASQGAEAVGRLSFRGPWFARDGERLVATPANIEIDADGNLARLDPLRRGTLGWQKDDLLPLWRRARGATKRRGGYLKADGVNAYLAGHAPEPDHIVDDDDLFATEDRVGIGMDVEKRSAREGQIYAVRLLRLRPEARLIVDVFGSHDDLSILPKGEDLLAIGGEARRAIVRRTASPARSPATSHAFDGKLALLTTPAPFGNWAPPGLTPVAAAMPGHVAVSGWDLARGGPKPNRFAAPAGSVYYFNDATALDSRGGSLCTGEDAAIGWGAFIEGGWNYA